MLGGVFASVAVDAVVIVVVVVAEDIVLVDSVRVGVADLDESDDDDVELYHLRYGYASWPINGGPLLLLQGSSTTGSFLLVLNLLLPPKLVSILGLALVLLPTLA